jgi:uncharacterized membrane protein (UPF0182 family)
VVDDGQVTWVLDLYTTTSRYPYAQQADSDQLTSESGLDHDFNYVRNSVKATVDAYEGTVTLYVVDDDDPIISAYRDAFPDLFTDGDEMPAGLREHVRYPEDLFRIQTAAYGRYHLTDPDDFFNQDDAWRVARDPGTAGADPNTQVTDEAGQPTGEERAARIAPYYQLLQLPQQEGGELSTEAEMVLMRPFVPFSEDDRSQLLSAFMAARMDGEDYGELMVYQMPSGDLPDGPGIAAGNIRGDDAVGELEGVLTRGGSEVRYGNMLLVPIDDALLYVQPFYVVAEGRELPQLHRVIAVFGGEVVMEETLADALTRLFGEEVDTQERPEEAPVEPGEEEEPDGGTTPGTVSEEAAALLAEADDLFAEADAALESGDIGEYQDKTNEAREKVTEAIELLSGGDVPSSGGGSGGSEGGSGGDASADDGTDLLEADDGATTTEVGTTAAAGAAGDDDTAASAPIALRAITPRR